LSVHGDLWSVVGPTGVCARVYRLVIELVSPIVDFRCIYLLATKVAVTLKHILHLVVLDEHPLVRDLDHPLRLDSLERDRDVVATPFHPQIHDVE